MTDTKREIPKAYDPSTTEDKWYKYWLDNELNSTKNIFIDQKI